MKIRSQISHVKHLPDGAPTVLMEFIFKAYNFDPWNLEGM